jgi:hypothetical protein
MAGAVLLVSDSQYGCLTSRALKLLPSSRFGIRASDRFTQLWHAAPQSVSEP